MDSSERTARLAGLAYLVNGVASMFGIVCAPLVPGGVAALTRAIVWPAPRFSVAIYSDLVAEVASVALVLLLYRLLRDVGELKAALMAILLVVVVPISFAISLTDVTARILSLDASTIAGLGEGHARTLAALFLRLHVHAVYGAEIFWGLWLLPFGLLVIRSRLLPAVLGVFLIVACAAYVTHGSLALLVPGERSRVFEVAVMAGRALGELPMIFWLLVRGAKPREAVLASQVS